jgi:tRNA A37 threonylcarbamoyladenosine synthetase subunit TsaC/SUA5/YrdC
MPDLPLCRMLVELLGEPVVTGSITAGEDEPALEDPEEFERLFRGRVEVVVDGGVMWPEPSTILQATDNELEVTRVGKGAVPET